MTELEWNDDISHEFYIHRLGMGFCATWPFSKRNFFNTLQYFILWSSTANLIFVMIAELYYHVGGIDYAIESTLLLIYLFIIIFKQSFMRLNKLPLQRALLSAFENWRNSVGNEMIRRIMKESMRPGRLLTIAFVSSGPFLTLTYDYCIIRSNMIQSRIYRENAANDSGPAPANSLVYPATWLIDKLTKTQYIALFTTQSCQFYLIAMVESCMDSFFFAIVSHVTGQIQVLKEMFSIFGQALQKRSEMKKELKELVKRHTAVIEAVKDLEAAFSYMLLLQLGLSATIIALASLRIIDSLKVHDGGSGYKTFVFGGFAIFESSIFIYISDRLTVCSEELIETVYQISWYQFPSDVVQDLGFIMARMEAPLKLSAGKLFFVSRTTMMDILKATFSYVSFLQVTVKD